MEKVCIVEGWSEAAKMIYEAKKPTGVMLMGNCSDARGRFAYSTLERAVGSVCLVSTVCSLERLQQAFKGSEVVCASLIPKDMCSQARRCRIATTLREAGAQVVYAVYLYDVKPLVPKNQPSIPILEIVPEAEGLDKVIIAIEQERTN